MQYKTQYKTPENRRLAASAWHREHRDYRLACMRKYRRKIREKVLQMLGGKCIYCGCDAFEALEINHKNGKGTIEYTNRKGGRSSTALVMDIHMGRRGIDDLEVVCIVCNAWHNATKLKGIPNNWQIAWES